MSAEPPSSTLESAAARAARLGLFPMTKVEVVVRSADVGLVDNLLRHAGVSGYTSLSAVSGLGHSGYHNGRLLFNDTDTLSLLIAVMPAEQSEAVLAGLRELFDEHSGVMFVSDTYVSRPDYFK
jgi:nitrogen regulatory protein PII